MVVLNTTIEKIQLTNPNMYPMHLWLSDRESACSTIGHRINPGSRMAFTVHGPPWISMVNKSTCSCRLLKRLCSGSVHVGVVFLSEEILMVVY